MPIVQAYPKIVRYNRTITTFRLFINQLRSDHKYLVRLKSNSDTTTPELPQPGKYRLVKRMCLVKGHYNSACLLRQ